MTGGGGTVYRSGMMNKTKAIERHAKRLRRLTNTNIRNLMEHAANKTPLLPCDMFTSCYVSVDGKC